jgi:hypothetical protein
VDHDSNSGWRRRFNSGDERIRASPAETGTAQRAHDASSVLTWEKLQSTFPDIDQLHLNAQTVSRVAAHPAPRRKSVGQNPLINETHSREESCRKQLSLASRPLCMLGKQSAARASLSLSAKISNTGIGSCVTSTDQIARRCRFPSSRTVAGDRYPRCDRVSAIRLVDTSGNWPRDVNASDSEVHELAYGTSEPKPQDRCYETIPDRPNAAPETCTCASRRWRFLHSHEQRSAYG